MTASASTATTAPDELVIVPRTPPRRDWRRAWGAIKILIADSERTDQVFVLLDALGGPSDEEGFQAFVRDPEGRRQLAERLDLLAVLSDHEALRALPEGSLGRAYLAFMEEAGLMARDLIDAEEAGTSAQADLDPDRRWVADRGRDSHDLWHVLTGYGADQLGEATLLLFSLAQTGGRANLVLALGANLRVVQERGLRWIPYAWRAWRRGRRATCLAALPYEKLLPLPLDEVRAAAGIESPERAHPAGVIRDDPIAVTS